MLSKKGMTLIESLFAFSIYITILTLFISFFTQGLNTEKRLKKNINNTDKEVITLDQDSLEKAIKQVLP